MKADVLIPTKDIKQIRPKLMEAILKAQAEGYVNNIIIDTTKPLATSRIVGSEKCTTEWIAMFDDDVEIPFDWFKTVFSRIKPGIVAISTPDINATDDFSALQKLADRLISLEDRDTPFIDNCLFKKSAIKGYDPPLAFYCEDEFFYEHIKKSGRWIHTPPIGVTHFYLEKDALYGGASQRIYKFEPEYVMLRRTIVRFILPIFAAIFYTHRLSTIYRFWRINVRAMAGWLMGESLKEKIGASWEEYKKW